MPNNLQPTTYNPHPGVLQQPKPKYLHAGESGHAKGSARGRQIGFGVIQNEIDRLAAAIHALRPDWPAHSLRTWLMGHCTATTYRDAAVMLTWVACDPSSKTPARMLERGPWRDAIKEPGRGEYRDQPKPVSEVITPRARHKPLPHPPKHYADKARAAITKETQ